MDTLTKQVIDQLRAEGYPVDDNPDLLDSLYTTSPYMDAETGRMQKRYWEIRRSLEK